MLDLTRENVNLFIIYTWDKEQNYTSIKRKPTVWRLEEELDSDVAFHPYYLTYMEII